MTSLGECLACESLGLRQSGSGFGAGLFVAGEAVTLPGGGGPCGCLWRCGREAGPLHPSEQKRSPGTPVFEDDRKKGKGVRRAGAWGCGDDWHPANPDLQMLETPPQRAKNARWGPRIGGTRLRGFLMLLGGVQEGNLVVSAAPALRPFGCAQGRVVAALVWVFLSRVKL